MFELTDMSGSIVNTLLVCIDRCTPTEIGSTASSSKLAPDSQKMKLTGSAEKKKKKKE